MKGILAKLTTFHSEIKLLLLKASLKVNNSCLVKILGFPLPLIVVEGKLYSFELILHDSYV